MKLTLETRDGVFTIDTKYDGYGETLHEATEIFGRLLLAAGYVFDPTHEQLELVDDRDGVDEDEPAPFYGQTDHTEDGVDPGVEALDPNWAMPCKAEGRPELPLRGDSTPIPQV
jgi:hypothetical protein